MKKSILFQVLATALAVSSALFARYMTQSEAPQEKAWEVMAYEKNDAEASSVTFSDLAEKITEICKSGDKL